MGQRLLTTSMIDRHTFTSNERNELADTFLHAFLCLFCDLSVLGEGSLHDTGDC